MEDYLVTEELEVLRDLVERIRRLERVQAGLEPAQKREYKKEVPPDARLKALGKELADRASEREDVRAFRKTHLRGRLLKFENVGRWIERQTERDGEPRPILHIPVPPGYTVSDVEVIDSGLPSERWGVWTDPSLTISRDRPAPGHRWLLLAYGTPDKGAVQRRPVAPGGVLDDLRILSESLASAYHWQPALATVFVLTGLYPDVYNARATVSVMYLGELPTARILLDIDSSVSAAEVSRLYADARRSLIVGGVGQRYRPMSEKHIQLAECYEKNGRRWKDRMREWNELHVGEKQYTEERNFARDCKRAWRRLYRKED